MPLLRVVGGELVHVPKVDPVDDVAEAVAVLRALLPRLSQREWEALRLVLAAVESR